MALSLRVDWEDSEKCALLLGEMSVMDLHLCGKPNIMRAPVVLSADRLAVWQDTKKNICTLIVIAINPLSMSE
jgi:hypothetical protein